MLLAVLEWAVHMLQAWKDLLQNTVEDSMPAALFLEQESPVLHVSVHVRVCACVCACACVLQGALTQLYQQCQHVALCCFICQVQLLPLQAW